MQSQQNTMKNNSKKEVDRVKEEYARMLALSCVHRKYSFSKMDPNKEERDKLTKKNLEMFEESYKAHLRSRPRDESPKSAPGFRRERWFDNHHNKGASLQSQKISIRPKSSIPQTVSVMQQEVQTEQCSAVSQQPARKRYHDLKSVYKQTKGGGSYG